MNDGVNIKQDTTFTAIPPQLLPGSLRQFASQIGYSHTTVHMAIRGTGGKRVSVKTRRKIRAILLNELKRAQERVEALTA